METKEQKLTRMLNSLGFGESIKINENIKVAWELKGFEIRRGGLGSIYVGHGLGNYGTRLTQLYLPSASAVVNYLERKGIKFEWLYTGYDPCLFNGL